MLNLLIVIVSPLVVFGSVFAAIRYWPLPESDWPEPLSAVDEQLAGLSRRYVHGDLTLAEFEEQVDKVLSGKFDPWSATPAEANGHFPRADPYRVVYMDALGSRKMASGTAQYLNHGGTAYL